MPALPRRSPHGPSTSLLRNVNLSQTSFQHVQCMPAVDMTSSSASSAEAAAKAERKAMKKAAKRALKAAAEEAARAETVEPESKEDRKKRKREKKRSADEEEPAAAAAATAEDAGNEEDDADRAARKAARKAAKKAKREAEASAGGHGAGGGSDEAEEQYRTKLGISVSGGGEGSSIPACLRTLRDAPFDKGVIKAMEAAGFTEPSTIQALTWPIAVDGKDLVAVAKTGSGKTLAFLLPAFGLVAREDGAGNRATPRAQHPRVLVLAPTRELAVQIEAECQKFARVQSVSSVCVYGGVPIGGQKAQLSKGPHVCIATPGRLCDLMNQGGVHLSECAYVVLDEADRMLDMGFEPQITQIFGALPAVASRQTLLFSATWPKNVRKLAGKFMRADPFHIFAQGGEDSELMANKAISQTFIQAQDDEKDAKLWKILEGLPESARVVIFANTKRRVDYLEKGLWGEGLGTCSIHGDKQQGDRDKALKMFIAGERPLMIATDVAARGLDIKVRLAPCHHAAVVTEVEQGCRIATVACATMM